VSVYASFNSPIVDQAGTVVDVALGVDDVRLGVWLEGTWEPSAYLTRAQALALATRLVECAARVGLAGWPLPTDERV
jgi:hypothetical protein